MFLLNLNTKDVLIKLSIYGKLERKKEFIERISAVPIKEQCKDGRLKYSRGTQRQDPLHSPPFLIKQPKRKLIAEQQIGIFPKFPLEPLTAVQNQANTLKTP